MAHAQDLEAHKRKRDADDYGIQPGLSQQATTLQQQGNPGFINYLSRSAENLTLLPGEQDTFADIIRILSGYEGVWERHESFAACLGAKLTGPRLLKGFEKFFEGPIKTNSTAAFSQPITWLDICTFAKTNPDDFYLTSLPDGGRCCRFMCKGLQVEISEDDWRFISSGALNRIPLEHPLEEDETAELATLDILEQRASVLWRKADEVAARSRILHHRLGQRRQDILRRHKPAGESSPSGSRFQSVNQGSRSSGHGTPYDLHADLLQQFIATSSATASRSTSGAGMSQGGISPGIATPQPQRTPGSGRLSTSAEGEGQNDTYRPLITQKIDKLARGDPITPACDRCRRLKLQCVKHLTACQGCTKKHAKCSWRSVSDEEVAKLKREMGFGVGGPIDADTEMGTPETRPSELARGTVTSPEDSRPASRTDLGGDGSGSHFGPHGMLSSPADGRIELPPMRMRMTLPQGHGSSDQRAETPLSQASTAQPGTDRQGYGPSNPPSR